MTEIVLKRWLLVLARHGLNSLGTVLVTQGLASQAELTALIVDAAPLVVGVLWSLYEKRWKPRMAPVPVTPGTFGR